MSSKKETSFEEERAMILGPFVGMAEDLGLEEACQYMVHVGIGIKQLDAAGGDPVLAIEQHYRNSKGFDLDRAAHDFFTYPRIAEEVRRQEAQKAHRREQNRVAKARSRKRKSQQQSQQICT